MIVLNKKYCPDCKEEKELAFFGKESANKDSLRSICKKCNSLRALKWHNNNKDHVNARERGVYKKDPLKTDEKNKKWRLNNPKKINAMNKQKWLNRDAEKEKKRSAEWRKNNKDKIKISSKKTYEKIKDRIRVTRQKWEQNNKGVRRAIVAKRRAIKIQATPKWLTKEDFLKIESFYILAGKLTKETGIIYEVDHIIPLNNEMVSGLHHWNNLQILTEEQNRSKSNKIIDIVGIFPEGLWPTPLF